MKSIVALITVALLSLAFVPSRLEAQSAAPTAEQRTRAREAYTRGQQLFDAGQFEEAQASFEEAYAQVPNPVVLLGVASAQERRGLRAEARVTLERYLRENPTARDRASIEARIAALPAPAAGTTTTTTTTTPTRVETTTTTTTTTEPTRVETTTTETAETTTETETTAVEAETEATETEAEATETEATETETPAPAGPSTAVWVLTAVGAVGLVAGTVFGFMALSRQSDFDAAPSLTAADEGEAFALVADISFGIALAGGIAAIVLYATEGGGTAAEEEDDTAFNLVPMVSPQGGGVVALGRF